MAIKAYFAPGQAEITVNGLYQWDKDQTLIIHDDTLPADVEVHFACAGMKEAACQSCTKNSGCVSAMVPDECLEQTTPIIAWVCAPTTHGSQTLRTIVLPVTARTAPGATTPSGAVIEDKIVDLDMADGDQVVMATPGKAMDTVIVLKPETMTPDNIKRGVNIGGVIGTMEQASTPAVITPKTYNVIENGEFTINPDEGSDGMSKVELTVAVPTDLIDASVQSKTFTENGTYYPDAGYNAFSHVVVDVAAKLQDKSVAPGVESQVVTADEGYDGLGNVTVEALQAQTVTPTTSQQTAIGNVTVEAVTSAVDANIAAGNIKEGVTILGVTGTVKEYVEVASVNALDTLDVEDGTLAVVTGA